MTPHVRLALFLIAAPGVLAMLLWGAGGLPGFGRYPGPYGDLINARGVAQRHVTDMPTAVNFDYREFDTLGEEYILFTSVAGIILLVRERRESPEESERAERSAVELGLPDEILRWPGRAMAAATLVFGIYMVLHGQLTPGGGFQGGVIIATSALLIYITAGHEIFHRLLGRSTLEASDALGASGYAIIGLAAMIAGGAFLENVLPLGEKGSILSGGTIPLIDFSVGVEVTAAFLLLFSAYLNRLNRPSPGEERKP